MLAVALVAVCLSAGAFAQRPSASPRKPTAETRPPSADSRKPSSDLFLAHLNAGPHAPLYTTYAAPLSRSEYFIDEAYHLNYDSPEKPVTYETDTAGEFSIVWRLGTDAKHSVTALAVRDYYKPPVIHRSYTDMVELEYWPFTTIEVHEFFVVYSSKLALLRVQVRNRADTAQQVTAYACYRNAEPIGEVSGAGGQTVAFSHTEDVKTKMEVALPQYDPEYRDIFSISTPADTFGGSTAAEGDITHAIAANAALDNKIPADARSFALGRTLKLERGQSAEFRLVRATQAFHDQRSLLGDVMRLFGEPLEPLIAESEAQYRDIPRDIKFPNQDWELAYWSAFNLVRQQMMPPEGDAHFNYYVFSREPTWSWGHDGQVFHESITMQAYAYMDARSAEDSQRVFIERQHPDGYMGYRVGPFVDKTFPLDGENTSSAPFFNWTNWEIYQVSHDRPFLQQAYDAGSKLADWFLKTHEKDGDGFLEWGANAMLENVRDSLDAVWTLFGGDDTSPKKVKSLDLTTMMVKETRSLALEARELGRADDARKWDATADRLAALVRTRMWDPQTSFFYNLARDSGSFVSKQGIDVRRKEIIGFLPLWAGIATREQAAQLRKEAANPASFNRRFGMPTLAANDPYFDPYITRCCQWNGAVWLLWDYMVMRGLEDYGYRGDAERVAQHAMDGVLFQLKSNHRFWESFSPDYTQLNSPKNYLWDAIIARMMIDLYRTR
ncbi:MAG TPA: trehalase family glycosidase [Terriglobales bacterium]|nr:trehalase family glycosidase [Terriglobales bacterium]